MVKSKKIIEVISFKNTIKDGRIIESCLTKMNSFLKTIDADDYISHTIDRTGTAVSILLTYKKTIK